LGLAGKKKTVKPGAKSAARKRASAKPVPPKSAQPKSVNRPDKRSVARAPTQTKNTGLAAELRTAMARQTATSDILRVISGSPTDVQPVFDAIVLTAARLLRCDRAFIQRCDSTTFWTVASAGPKGPLPIMQSTKAPLDPDANFPSRAIVARKTLHLPDWSAIELPEFERQIREIHGTNSALYMPLLRAGDCIGLLCIIAKRANMFGKSEIALAESFRDQALIAIENARLFNETREALARQTATADILKVIASSPSDVQPVFEKIVDSAARLFEPCAATIVTLRGEEMHWNATAALRPDFDVERARSVYPMPFAPDRFPSARAIAERRIVEILDANAPDTPDVTRRAAAVAGFRSVTFVPLINDSKGIGTIILTHPQAGFRLSEQQLALVQTFADQAVIAIENARLFNETKEALEQQTATSEVLQVIGNSMADTQPVFERILDSVERLFDCRRSLIFLAPGDGLMHLVARRGMGTASLDAVYPQPIRQTAAASVLGERQQKYIPDAMNGAGVPESLRRSAQATGNFSVVMTPMLWEGQGIGMISVTREPDAGFTLKEFGLLKTFADQAVIAVQNARMFNETKEALERQTATADILKVIASSPSDVQPVFDAIATSANRLLGGFSTTVFRFIDGALHLMAFTPTTPAADEVLKASFPAPVADHPLLELVRDGEVVQIADAEALSDVRVKDIAQARGFRSIIWTPLMSNGAPIGMIGVTRLEPGSFATHHVQLLQTFADQAVIAIENVRLFDQVQARTEDLRESLQQQTATAGVLGVISRSAFDLKPVFETVAESSVKLCGSDRAIIFRFDGELLRPTAAFNAPDPLMDWLERNPIRPGRHSVAARAALERRTIQVEDVVADPEHTYGAKDVEPFRTVLGVPMLKGDDLLGVILVYHNEVRPFSDKQIALVETFADQAVIAIENVRLFDEVQAKTRDLTEALQFQTATSDVLKVISSSPDTLQPVLDVIVETSRELCGSDASTIYLLRNAKFHVAAQSGVITPHMELLRNNPQSIDQPGSVLSRVAREKRTLHFPNIVDDPQMKGGIAAQGGPRALLVAPLMRDGQVIGAIVLRQSHLVPFTPPQIEVIETFADQAVIAISNVNLFEQVQERTRDLTEALQQQTATADVLKVISSSPGELEPVFQALLENAVHLCEAQFAMLFLPEENEFRAVGKWNLPPAYSEFLGKNTISADPRIPLARAAITKRPVQVADILVDQSYIARHPGIVAVAEDGGARTLLQVPMLKENELVGAIGIYRQEVRPFTDKQIALVQNFAAQAVIAIENARLLNELRQRTSDLTQSLDDLRTAQDRLVQTEKLASLGQLTAGIAHEIKNPLNFVNNFSALSAELVDELNDTLKPAALNDTTRKEVDDLTQTLKDNLEKVVQHGKRADSIVKNMLLHSREGSGEHRPTDINALLDESLNLAYHGARAEKREFNITLQRDFDATAGAVEVFPQEITRVFLNLISNGFYAVTKRKTENGNSGFEPVLRAATRNLGNNVEIRIRDNGTGIPAEVREKMFNPFFTTKPAGEGTGLGLSMSHDIIVKQHGGSIDVETEPGQFTEFRIVLPRTSIVPEKRG
jgi:two-component system NtrC family sensor kinase